MTEEYAKKRADFIVLKFTNKIPEDLRESVIEQHRHIFEQISKWLNYYLSEINPNGKPIDGVKKIAKRIGVSHPTIVYLRQKKLNYTTSQLLCKLPAAFGDTFLKWFSEDPPPIIEGDNRVSVKPRRLLDKINHYRRRCNKDHKGYVASIFK